MPIPIIAGVAASVSSSIITQPFASVLGSLIAPWTREAGYESNRNRPNLIGPPEAIAVAWAMAQIHPGPLGGTLSQADAAKLLQYHGIAQYRPHLGDGLAEPSYRVFQETMMARRARPSLDALLQMYARGIIETEDRLKELARWYIPDFNDFQEWLHVLCYTLSPEQIIHAKQRKVFGALERDVWLQRIGVVSPAEQRYWREREREIAPISDVIRMLVRESFDGPTVQTERYMEDFPPDVLEWAERLGYGWQLGLPSWLNAGLPNPTWAHLYWAAHWVRMSPTQSAEALHRNRPGRVAAADVWTQADHQRLLKITDYAPRDRRQLELISYRPIGRIDIRRAHYLGAISDAEVNERFQDIGYSNAAVAGRQSDSSVQAETVIRDNRRRKFRDLVGLTRQKIQQAHTAGLLNDTQAVQQMIVIGYDALEAQAAVALWVLEWRLGRLKKLSAGVRKNYLLGDYDAVQATNLLSAYGVNATRISEYLNEWDQIKRQYRLEVAPQRLTDWLLYGVIDQGEMRRRLVNLGWASEDIDRMIRYAIAKNQRRAPPDLQVPKGKGGRAGLSKSSELTRAEIRQLYLEGLLSRDEAAGELGVLALDPTDTALLLTLWDRQRG